MNLATARDVTIVTVGAVTLAAGGLFLYVLSRPTFPAGFASPPRPGL